MEANDQPLAADSQSASSSDANEPIRTEDILLERLKSAPPVKPQIPPPMLFGIVMITIALGVIVYFISKTPEKYAEDPHAEARKQAAADSAALFAKRMKLQPYVDSLAKVVASDPANPEFHKEYANALYEANDWQKAQTEYEAYLKGDPKDPDAIIDYAYVLTQTTQDYRRAIDEIEKALKIDPEHVKGLFNAGLLSVQAFPDKKTAIEKSEGYFNRARAAAEKKGETEMVKNIDEVLAEIAKIKSNPNPGGAAGGGMGQ
ncbi:MAG: tetratricopeptide repeat protein [Bacteroidetes bacterium]|nr:tetratricopeptide repeat protein [Bacteroidota bacterium]